MARDMHTVGSAPRLLDQVRDTIRLKHYSIRTEQSYLGWARRFILFHNKRHPRDMGAVEVTAFLTDLAVRGNVAAATQNQALNAILFLYREVLKIDLPWMDGIQRAKKPARLPVVFTRAEVKRLLAQLDGTLWLMASLIYGSGMRLMECVRLRVKDIDFHYKQIIIRDAKGQKDRVTMLPESLIDSLRNHLVRVRELHEQDLKTGFGRVYLPHALDRKYPNAGREWGWAAHAHPCARGIRTSLYSTICVSGAYPLARPAHQDHTPPSCPRGFLATRAEERHPQGGDHQTRHHTCVAPLICHTSAGGRL